jgi:hypothetical protein
MFRFPFSGMGRSGRRVLIPASAAKLPGRRIVALWVGYRGDDAPPATARAMPMIDL